MSVVSRIYVSIATIVLGLSVTQVANANTFRLTIGVHPRVTYSESNVLRTVTIMQEKLLGSCGPATFEVARVVSLDAGLPHNVNLDAPGVLELFAATGTSVQVVASITHCGGAPARGFILGCARRGGPVLVKGMRTRDADAQVWAHEIGRAQGLGASFSGYENAHNPTSGFLMFASANPRAWAMDHNECKQFYSRQTFPPRSIANPMAVISTAAAMAGEDRERSPAEEFLASLWFHGLDFAAFERDREAILEAAIASIDIQDVELWPNAVLVIGYAGEDGAFEQVRHILFSEGNGEDRVDAGYRNDARINAATALGYLAYQGDRNAIELLQVLRNPNANFAVVPFARDDMRDEEVFAQELAISTSVGLAIAAAVSEEAEFILFDQRMRQQQGAFDIGVDDGYFDLLDALTEDVRANGLFEALR